MLEIRDLFVSYGSARALSGVSARVLPGQVLLVLGPNGAGKTTMLRSVFGLKSASSGDILVDGHSITGIPAHKLAKSGLMLVPEGRGIFSSLTVEENLLMGGYTASSNDARLRALENVYETFPILSERRSGRAGWLSGGEQQMLAVGRALMASPKYVLMDEPSMGLAPAIIERVHTSARSIADSGVGVLMVEQNADSALEVADNVIVLQRGAVVFEGDAARAKSERIILQTFLGVSALET